MIVSLQDICSNILRELGTVYMLEDSHGNQSNPPPPRANYSYVSLENALKCLHARQGGGRWEAVYHLHEGTVQLYISRSSS